MRFAADVAVTGSSTWTSAGSTLELDVTLAGPHGVPGELTGKGQFGFASPSPTSSSRAPSAGAACCPPPCLPTESKAGVRDGAGSVDDIHPISRYRDQLGWMSCTSCHVPRRP